jgi:hypothetical protein
MRRNTLRAGAIGATLLAAMATTALADIKDYEFQLVGEEVRQGAATVAMQKMLALKAAP